MIIFPFKFFKNKPKIFYSSKFDRPNLILGFGTVFYQKSTLCIVRKILSHHQFVTTAYALAKVCYHYDIPFISFKYITDGADEQAHEDWEANLASGILEFKEKVLKIEGHVYPNGKEFIF